MDGYIRHKPRKINRTDISINCPQEKKNGKDIYLSTAREGLVIIDKFQGKISQKLGINVYE